MRLFTTIILFLGFTFGCGGNASTSSADANRLQEDLGTGINLTPDTLSPLPNNICPGTIDYFSATTCNSLENSAPAVPFSTLASAPPTFTGGTILDGKYYASKVEGFGPTTGTGRKVTIVVAQNATKFYWKGEVLDGTRITPFSAVMTAKTEGNQLMQTKVCSVGGVELPTMNYTATSTEMTLSITSGNTVFATTYARMGCP